jgi:secondary thiamine-phosphate synthase enzyme
MVKIAITTSRRTELVPVTRAVQAALAELAGVGRPAARALAAYDGGVTVNEQADPDVAADLERALAKLVPWNAGYAHAEGNSAAHIQTALVGVSALVPVKRGRLALGTWQGLFLCEFDGPARASCG